MVEITPEAVLLKQGDLRLPVSLRCPSFTIDGAEVGGKTLPAGPVGKMESGKALELPFAPIALGDSSRLEVKLYVEWSADESVLRKWAAYRLDNAKGPKLVSQVVLEDLDTKAAGLRLLPEQPIDSDGMQSRPVFLEGFFAGIEYPVAQCRAENERLILSHRPGLRIQPGTWYETRKAVYGVAPAGGEKNGFKRYIDAHRPRAQGEPPLPLQPLLEHADGAVAETHPGYHDEPRGESVQALRRGLRLLRPDGLHDGPQEHLEGGQEEVSTRADRFAAGLQQHRLSPRHLPFAEQQVSACAGSPVGERTGLRDV